MASFTSVLYLLHVACAVDTALARASMQKFRGSKASQQLSEDLERECPICTSSKAGQVPTHLNEASALAESAIHAGVWYSINNSPEELMIHAMDSTGRPLSSFRLEGVDLPQGYSFGNNGNGDIEALTVGPCTSGAGPGSGFGSCLYAGDIGQNCARHHDEKCDSLRPDGLYSIMRFPEPEHIHLDGKTIQLYGARFWFELPPGHGPYDAETLFKSRHDGLFMVTKVQSGSADLFQIPLSTRDDVSIAVHKGAIPAPTEGESKFTDGSIRRKGEHEIGITLLTTTHAWYYPIRDGQSISEALVQQRPCPAVMYVNPSREPQAEGVGWFHDGTSFLSCGEQSADGKTSEIVRIRCH